MTDDDLRCDVCGELATPGGLPGEPEIDVVCPPCEDQHRANKARRTGYTARTPPHGGTTR